jgi:solute carrier family 8 (sodium/calcium exchanger)
MPCQVQFDTSDGDAVSGDDYVNAAGTLEFPAGVTEQEIKVKIIDDDEWAPDKHFYARLYGAKVTGTGDTPEIVIGTATTQVTILNDDDPGTISFEAKTFHAMDTKQTVEIPLIRKDGNDGNVLAFIKTRDGTATANQDYVPLSEDFEVHFDNKVTEAKVAIDLLHNQENANSTFTVEITHLEPEGAKVGDFSVCTVIITNDKNYQKLMEDVVAMMDSEMGKYGVGTSSWAEQFHDAMNMGGDDDGSPEFGDYLMHFLSFYWKVLHALIPPTDYGGGWYTFVVSLVFIGVITMFVGDTAKMLGCCIGLADAITAITFVALGTSLPDTFASVEATTSDDTADAAITNVTGSNSVNVFLGLGLPWVMACLYHAANGTTFYYKSGDLVFSVLVYFVFAFICIGILYVRRKKCGGELGGNKTVAYASSAALGTSWLLYIVLSALATEGHIDTSGFSR